MRRPPLRRLRLPSLFLLLTLLVSTLATAADGDRSLVHIRTAGENGPAFTSAGLPLAAEVPGGYLAFLAADELARLDAWNTQHTVIAVDRPGTDVIVRHDVQPGDRATSLPPAAETLYRADGFTVLRLPHDENRILSCLPDIQRIFRRPLRFVSRPWDDPLVAASREPDADIQDMVDTVDPVWLQEQVQALEDFGTRHSQYEGGELASYWLRDQFFGYGYFDVQLHDYNTWNDNVVCTKPGASQPDKYVVIGGHYDSISNDGNQNAPGADDNATGTVAVMAAARAMAAHEFEYTVVFIAFSGEEQGLYGSEAWASEAADAGLDVVASIAFDMLGYRAAGDAADIDIITNSASQPLRDLVDVAIADYVPDHVAVDGSLPGGASSDHASFWANGYRSILFFEDSGNYSPYIHTADDLIGPSVNDFDFMEQNVRTAVAATAMLARPFRIAIDHQPLSHAPGEGPFPVTCRIVAAEPLDPATLQLHYRTDGSPFTTVALAATGEPDEYAAEIPELFAGMLVEYYLSAGDELGRTATDPVDAPASLHAFRTGVTSVFADDVETDQGWTLGAPGDDATTGLWIWADPVGTTYQPEDDHTPDPGHLCFVTGNGMPGDTAGAQDVDGGRTTLLSPIIDLTGAEWAEFSYWRYYVLATTLDDVFTVDISNDGGQTWTNVETVTGTEGWTRVAYQVDGSEVMPTHLMQLRFIAEDHGGGSLVEALIDDLEVIVSYGVPMAVDDRTPPATASLGAFPNPFNPRTTLAYSLPRAGYAELRVFDARGREVARPLASDRPAGRGEVAWNAGGLASGVYLVQLSLDGVVERATKLTLVR